MPNNPNHQPGFAAFFARIPVAQHNKIISLKKICDACTNMDYDVIQTKLGTHVGTCLRYHLVGSCGLRSCGKEHSPLTMPVNAVTDICVLLGPGMHAALSRS